MKRIFIILSIFFFLPPLLVFNQNIVTIDTLENENIHVVTDDFECVIFSPNNDSFYVSPSITKWMPTIEEVLLCDAIIKKYVSKKERKRATVLGDSPIIHENYYRYVRQYMGYIDKHGRKILSVNFIWKETAENTKGISWLNRSNTGGIDVGTFFWQINVNLRRKRCFNFNWI